MTDLRDPPECERCGDEYTLRHGDDPTPHCDHYAHELVASLAAENRQLRERAEKAEALAHHAGDGIVQLDAWREALEARATRAEAENERLREAYSNALSKITALRRRVFFAERDGVTFVRIDDALCEIINDAPAYALQPAATKGEVK